MKWRIWAFSQCSHCFGPTLKAGPLYNSRSYGARLLLGSFEELATPFFPDLAGSSLPENRVTCCAMLHAYHPQGSVEVLLKLLDDADAGVRFEACCAAEFYNDPRVVSKLLALLKDPWDAICRGATLSCGKLGVSDPRVIAGLIDLLDYDYPAPRVEARAALVRITGQELKSSKQWRDWWARNKSRFTTQQRL
jgi:hypothetical protein